MKGSVFLGVKVGEELASYPLAANQARHRQGDVAHSLDFRRGRRD
jgi:hypothetical protein